MPAARTGGIRACSAPAGDLPCPVPPAAPPVAEESQAFWSGPKPSEGSSTGPRVRFPCIGVSREPTERPPGRIAVLRHGPGDPVDPHPGRPRDRPKPARARAARDVRGGPGLRHRQRLSRGRPGPLERRRRATGAPIRLDAGVPNPLLPVGVRSALRRPSGSWGGPPPPVRRDDLDALRAVGGGSTVEPPPADGGHRAVALARGVPPGRPDGARAPYLAARRGGGARHVPGASRPVGQAGRRLSERLRHGDRRPRRWHRPAARELRRGPDGALAADRQDAGGWRRALDAPVHALGGPFPLVLRVPDHPRAAPGPGGDRSPPGSCRACGRAARRWPRRSAGSRSARSR